MRLLSLKLAGFKSFADPTTVDLPGQMVGVVGPNGCGKSNIIDAVRWVLGESRASELRGGSMQDVIFNGTDTRNPAGRCSVEMLFDNSAHTMGGQWREYAQISVKRVLSRSGGSQYFLNNQQVRRRDVHDVFLGTGLGPRAYAIIGQGTISRIIESKPEELRMFLEEAAGVTKYKERRRETQNRLADTQENLLRVQDVLGELDKQIAKLEKQAAVAQEYEQLNARKEQLEYALWFQSMQEAQAKETQANLAMREQQSALEERFALVRKLEAEVEETRQAHYDAGDALNQAQGALYEAGAQVAKHEAEVQFLRDSEARLSERQQSLVARQTQAQQTLAQNATASEGSEQQLEQLEEAYAVAQAQLEEQEGVLPELEVRLSELHDAQRQAVQAVQTVQHDAQQARSDARVYAQKQEQWAERRDQLHAQFSDLQLVDEEEVSAVQAQYEQLEADGEQAQAEWDALQAEQEQHKQHVDGLRQQLQQYHKEQAVAESEQRTLQRLQEQERSGSQDAQSYAQRHGWDTDTIWSRIQVAAGWEKAVETALSALAGAFALDEAQWQTLLENAQVTESGAAVYCLPSEGAGDKEALSAAYSGTELANLPCWQTLVQSTSVSMQSFLTRHWRHVFFAQDVQQARSALSNLPTNARVLNPVVFTADGHCVGVDTLVFAQGKATAADAGVLHRQTRLRELEQQLQKVQNASDAMQTELEHEQLKQQSRQQRIRNAQQRMQELNKQRQQAQMQSQKLQQQLEHQRQRQQQAQQELDALQAKLAEGEESGEVMQARVQELEHELEEQQASAQLVQDSVYRADQEVASARNALLQQERAVNQAHMQLQTARNEAQQRGLQVQQAQTLMDDVVVQLAQIEQELLQLSAQSPQQALQAALDLKTERQNALATVRSQYDGLTEQLRKLSEQRMQADKDIEPLRERISAKQLSEQEHRLQKEQFAQRLQAAEADLEQVKAFAQEQQQSNQQLEALCKKIQQTLQAMGPVNLAALQELEQEAVRKGHLASQYDDLQSAIETLENAIIQIDSETRDLLSHTYNVVNEAFGRLFPRLFGGGRAHLKMTDDEILYCGVQVMAQPPGKKNQTIQLLSGGEKALTAIALVFAMFELNPAPFCLLDEVDAPLDDANTSRYVELVKEMSQNTQFLFISHNKVAMEAAQQLVGVTMQERGVSRVVAVDVDSALEAAETTATEQVEYTTS